MAIPPMNTKIVGLILTIRYFLTINLGINGGYVITAVNERSSLQLLPLKGKKADKRRGRDKVRDWVSSLFTYLKKDSSIAPLLHTPVICDSVVLT